MKQLDPGTPSTEWCTSGRAIIGLSGQHEPCGEPLVVIGKSKTGEPVRVCRECDRLPRPNERPRLGGGGTVEDGNIAR